MFVRLPVVTVLVVLAAQCLLVELAPVVATVYFEDNAFVLRTGVFDRAGLAAASYDQKVNTTGWATLSISSPHNEKATPAQRGYACGLLEGALSYDLIWDAYQNWIESSLPPQDNGSLPPKVVQFVNKQKQWMESQAAQNPNVHYWQHISVLLNQVDGMVDGYNRAQTDSSKKLSAIQVYTLTMAGDLEDLLVAIKYDWGKIQRNLATVNPKDSEHMDCSGLVKILPDFSELFVGHTTFNAYWCMLRIFKHYDIDLRAIGGAATITSFSSRPGDLHSKDDFFLMNSGLVVIETSLTTFNSSLFQFLIPQSVPCWARSQLANRMAKDAVEWAALFSQYNSGTHNNEWIVSDYKKIEYQPDRHVFSRNSEKRTSQQRKLQPNTVVILDQMGPFVEYTDVTFDLLEKQQMVPSFNIPYFPFIFNVSGYRAAGFNYDKDVRHMIFVRDQSSVTSLPLMAHLMNSNDYKNDPLSGGNACNAISARCDLNPSGATSFGGIDCKVVDSHFASSQRVLAISGQSHQTQPPFSFSPTWNGVAHRGMPDRWDFDWGIMEPAHHDA